MNLLTYVIIGLLVSVLLGCIYNTNNQIIHNYVSENTTSLYKNNISFINDDDVNYIKQIIPEKTLTNIANKFLPSEKTKYPNDDMIPEDMLDKENKNYNNELPWDTDVTPCDILKDTDQDLYKNVLDSNMITFY
jgi:hypothetical protein